MDQKHSIITRVEKQKRHPRYNIYINEEYAFAAHEDLVIKHRLLKGASLEAELIRQIIQEEELHQAYLYAIRVIGRRPHSAYEIKEKLKTKGYDGVTANTVLEKLIHQRYVNDLDFAKAWVEHRVRMQKKGARWVRHELRQKGVSQENVEKAMADLDRDAEWEAAVQLGDKKWRQTKGEPRDKKRKVAAYLLRRGYSSAIVKRVVNTLINRDSEDEATETIFNDDDY
ncbi:Regulatory protein recX [Chlamydia abortus]|uniref:Regulatory protein RecX n=1 Tax=Paenibacillus residui TaxID=629724 RepID=A0ABW3D812_9BACL|nr:MULTISPECIES: RecX family transcriptional regulator [Paenibacillaceae]SHE10931.1 Regulatory protein recX [Chlamydia abortus]